MKWDPKMCERCGEQPATVIDGYYWDEPGGREQARAQLCDDCNERRPLCPEFFHCDCNEFVEALHDLRSGSVSA